MIGRSPTIGANKLRGGYGFHGEHKGYSDASDRGQAGKQDFESCISWPPLVRSMPLGKAVI